jgi:hypothetical protein
MGQVPLAEVNDMVRDQQRRRGRFDRGLGLHRGAQSFRLGGRFRRAGNL